MFNLSSKKKFSSSKKIYSTKEGDFSYTLKRSSRRRTFSVCIDECGDCSVSVPFISSDKAIRDFLKEKECWILTKIDEQKRQYKKRVCRRYIDGDKFLFLGKEFVLNVIEKDVKRTRINFDQGWSVIVNRESAGCDREKLVEKTLIKWYRFQALEVIGGRIFHFSRIIGVDPLKIAVRTQKRLWGCCYYQSKTIHINWQIILAPMDVLDYVVVHELCHLLEPNHSQRFWKNVEKNLPSYKTHMNWLKDNQSNLRIPTVKC